MTLIKKMLRKKEIEGKLKAGFEGPLPFGKTVLISDHLKPGRILLFEGVSDHRIVLDELIMTLPVEKLGLVSAAIGDREAAGSTVVAQGISFPHARIPDINEVAAAMGICAGGVRMHPSENPIHLFFLFVSPLQHTRAHLRFLASASSLFLQENFLEILLDAKTPESLFVRIKEAELKMNRSAGPELIHA